jgi:hypothetical protein
VRILILKLRQILIALKGAISGKESDAIVLPPPPFSQTSHVTPVAVLIGIHVQEYMSIKF